MLLNPADLAPLGLDLKEHHAPIEDRHDIRQPRLLERAAVQLDGVRSLAPEIVHDRSGYVFFSLGHYPATIG
jgi:hypothetical protein